MKVDASPVEFPGGSRDFSLSDSADHRRGMDACRDVRSLNPSVKCIILTTFEDEWTPRDVELAGASGYVLKNVQGVDLGPAILRVVDR